MSAFEDTWTTGTVLGDHVVIDRLGQGGMGAVYLARHRQTGALQAMKVLERGADEEERVRFQREGEAMARVDAHPNVVRVHSLEQRKGRYYLILDLADGGSLRDRIRTSGPLPPDEAARIARDLARGLHHVHAHGVLHRDLKPANVLFDAAGTPKLTDFGLAKLSGSDSLTATGVVIGSPAYLAPEQAGAREADVRTDVFGLGAILFHALCGRPPFMGTTILEVLVQSSQGVRRGPRSENPAVPEALDRICLRALAKDPDARYPTAEALADDLDRYLRGDEPTARAPRRVAPLALLLLIALAVPLGIVLWPAPPPAAPAPPPAASASPSPTATARPLTPAEHLAAARRLPPGPEALDHLRRAADGEAPGAVEQLAWLNLDPRRGKPYGLLSDHAVGMKMLQELGSAEACVILGKIYRDELDRELEAKHFGRLDALHRKALFWLRKGHRMGSPAATYELGRQYQDDDKAQEAADLYREVIRANRGPVARAAARLGKLLFMSRHDDEALGWFRFAALLGERDGFKRMEQMVRAYSGQSIGPERLVRAALIREELRQLRLLWDLDILGARR